MGMELLIAIIAVAVVVILWAIRKDMSIGTDATLKVDEKAAREEFAKEVRDWANETTEKMTVTETEKTEVVVEDKEPAKAVKKSVTKKAPAVKKAPAKKKVAAPKTKAAPKKKVAPAKKKAAPKK